MRFSVLASLALTGPALAQAYPFEGRWREGDNPCDAGLVITATRMEMLAAGGGCRFTSLRKTGSTGYSYAARCNDDTGRYSTSGTFQMAGPNRFVMRDRLMQGQSVTYDRC